MELMEKLSQSKAYIEARLEGRKPQIGIILGSGLGDMADAIEDAVIIDYHDIPHFPVSTVPGHKGRLVIGGLEGKTVLCMQGRFHYYEGYSMDEVVYPIRTMKMLGINALLLTNAAGCVNTAWKPGDLMLITDHIKLIADNPLRGRNPDELGERFFDMTQVYDKELVATAEKTAGELSISVRKGVYMLFTGPSFETAAEVRFARMAGADAVGMSTVPEAIAASHMRMKTMGISCLTNMAAGILDQPLNHEEVLETGERVKKTFAALVRGVVASWPEDKL